MSLLRTIQLCFVLYMYSGVTLEATEKTAPMPYMALDISNINWTDPDSRTTALIMLSNSLIEAKEEIKKVLVENENITQEVKKLNTEIARVTTENENLSEEVKKVTTENEKLTADSQNFTETVRLVIGENENLNAKFEKLKSDFRTLASKNSNQNLLFQPPLGANYTNDFLRDPTQVELIESVAAGDSSILEQLIRLMVPVSCYEWGQYGFEKSGYYLIDPDGKGIGEPPFMVYCDLKSGYSFVHHDNENVSMASSCRGPGCHVQNIKYTASEKQIQALMKRSDSCQQLIRLDCFQSPLRKDGKLLSWWTDRHGNEHGYWAGSGENAHMCSCGLSRSCVDPRKHCNCNAEDRDVHLMDRGYITEMESLPVMSLQFGSTPTQDLQVNYTLGPLRCFGSHPIEHPTSCFDLWISGFTQSGYYLLKINGTLQTQFCNMTTTFLSDQHSNSQSNQAHILAYDDIKDGLQSLSEPMVKDALQSMSKSMVKDAIQSMLEPMVKDSIQSLLEPMVRDSIESLSEPMVRDSVQSLVKPPMVVFSAYSQLDRSTTNSYYIFEKITLNLEDGYDASTGLFTAPTEGIYYFSANLQNEDNNHRISASINRNGNEIAKLHTDEGDINEVSVSTSVAVQLDVGDTVGVYLLAGAGEGGDGKTAVFNGFLLR